MKIKLLILGLVLVLGVGLLVAGCGDEGSSSSSSTSFTLTSTSWAADGGTISAANLHDSVTGGLNKSPQLTWANAPTGTMSFAIKMIDAQSSSFIHWLVHDIPSTESSVVAGANTSGMPTGSTTIDNSFTSAEGGTLTGYGGPAPPIGDGTHTYTITIYALNVASISPGATNTTFTASAAAASLGTATWAGIYSR